MPKVGETRLMRMYKVEGMRHYYAIPHGKKFVIWSVTPVFGHYQVSKPVTIKQAKESLGMVWNMKKPVKKELSRAI
jgi:hypothetical protein